MIDFKKYENELISLRREFHKIPEVSLKEYKTSEKIRNYLIGLGISDIKTYADTGLAAVIYGKGDKTVGIRADIDALFVQEETNLPYKSENEGVMHACGHDGHIAIALVLAKIFWENRELLKGNIKLIFQPAEEEGDGAKRMIDGGVLENPRPDFMLSGHLWPEIEAGKIDITDDITFAGSDIIKIEVNGKGGHGALPHNIKDSLYTASKIAIALKEKGIELNKQGITNILSICSFDCKSQFNIFKDDACLLGTLRTVNKEHREKVIEEIKNTVKVLLNEGDVCGNCEITVDAPPLINNKKLAKLARDVIASKMGGEVLCDFGPVMASEDFAYFSNEIPSVHLKIGSGGDEVEYPALHNSKYEMNEKSLITGVEAFYNIITELLE